jgi:hypothetical protein
MFADLAKQEHERREAIHQLIRKTAYKKDGSET